MYLEFYNLKKLPFENVPDPDFFFDSGAYANAYKNICSSVDAGRGLFVLAGPIGSGKTTLSQMVIKQYEKGLNLIWMAEPPEKGIDILYFLARELGVTNKGDNRVFLIDDIRSALLNCDDRCFLIIDEAHLMDEDVASTLRTLNNLEVMSKKLIQIFLLGQEELIAFTNKKELAPFKQRITYFGVLEKMERSDVVNYIQHRLMKAGSTSEIFTQDAYDAITIGSGGVPRLVNTICDRALSCAASKSKKRADVEDVYDATQGVVDRKEIFQLMLSIRNRSSNRDDKGFTKKNQNEAEERNTGISASVSENDASSIADLTDNFHISVADSSSDIFSSWVDTEINEKKSLKRPFLHLVLSGLALAGSLLYFKQSTVDGFDRLYRLFFS